MFPELEGLCVSRFVGESCGKDGGISHVHSTSGKWTLVLKQPR